MDLRVGKIYQLVKKIGSGAFGEIYEGKQPKLQRGDARSFEVSDAA